MIKSNSMMAKFASRVSAVTNKKKFYTTEEKIAYIKNEYGLTHGKGKRKRKGGKRK